MADEKVIPKSRYVGYAIAWAEILFATCYFGWRLADWLFPLISAWTASARDAAIAAVQATPMPTATPIPLIDGPMELIAAGALFIQPLGSLIMILFAASMILSVVARVLRSIE